MTTSKHAWLYIAGLAGLIGSLTACTNVDSPEACKLTHLTDIPIRVVSGQPVIEVQVAGKPLRVILDTGAEGFIITPEAAERLGLDRDYSGFRYTTGLGAMASNWATKPVVVQLGSVVLKPASLTVATFLTPSGSSRPEGLLGDGALSSYDLDVDIARRQVALYEGRHCPGGAAPLDGPFVSLPTGRAGPFRMTVSVLLDGTSVPMLVDTGASRTMVDAKVAGLSEADLSADRAIQVNTADPVGLKAHVRRFRTLQVGSDVIQNPLLVVGQVDRPGYSGLLGMDYWRDHRLWISYGSQTLFVGPSRPR